MHAEMVSIKLCVARYSSIFDFPVKHGAYGEPSRPVVCCDGELLAGKILMLHVYEAPLGEARLPPLHIADAHSAAIKPASKIKFLAVDQYLDLAQIEPVPV